MTEEGNWLLAALEQFEGPLLRYATYLMGNLDQARDVVQDTFLRLCHQDRARVEGHLAEWLFTVCRNRAVDLRRKEAPMASVELFEVETPDVSSPGMEARVMDEDEHERVMQMMRDLPRNQQEVVRLKFQNDLSYVEISRITNLSVSNVGFLLHTAIKTLRQRMCEASVAVPASAEKGW